MVHDHLVMTIPTNDVVYATKKVATPTKDVVYATKKVVTPTKDVAYATKKVVTPTKDVAHATKKVVTPTNRVAQRANASVLAKARRQSIPGPAPTADPRIDSKGHGSMDFDPLNPFHPWLMHQ